MQILFAHAERDPIPWVQAFQQALPEHTITLWTPDLPPQDAELAIVWRPPAELFTRETRLRAVFNLGAGADALLALPTLPAELPVVRLEDAGMGLQMAEYVLHALWRAARGFDAFDAAQRRSSWEPLPGIQRRQWPVGVLGLGAVGARVAQAVAGFGFPVAGWSRTARDIPQVQGYVGREQLPVFLARTRVLVNVLPLTPDTRHILNRGTLGGLLPDAWLINIGRGDHLAEDDLIPLLDAGRLQGAALDVFATEPLPASHPFWRHPAIRVTPHIAAASLREETVDQIAGKIRRMAAGQPVTGVIERDRGY